MTLTIELILYEMMDVMFSGRPPGGCIANINIVIMSANIIHILIIVCDTVYGNVLDYISLLSLMIIMYWLTPISHTLYFRLYQYVVFLIKCLECSTTLGSYIPDHIHCQLP